MGAGILSKTCPMRNLNQLAKAMIVVGGMLLVIASIPVAAGNGTTENENYRDLNKNGVMDPYENKLLPVENRVADLLSRMTLAEKVGQMMHPTFVPQADGSPPYYLQEWVENKGVGWLLMRGSPGAMAAANCTNQIQAWGENSRLGIPVVISMDSIHGLSYVKGAMVHPHDLGLAATENVELVRKLTEMHRKESIAIGVRETLSPVADVATEPRWGRVYEDFGENADLVAEMVRAEVEAFQAGTELNENSVMSTTKHFPGAGPQMDGMDMAPIVTTAETLEYHLKPWKAAIEAGTGAVMPYYSIPLLLDNMAALGSEPTLQGLLRENLGFEGIIVTDWGMVWAIRQAGMYYGKNISQDEALEIGLGAGVDVIGGPAITGSSSFIDAIVRLVGEGKIHEENINSANRRILRAKFKLGVFDDPYVDPDYAENIVGYEEHQALSLEAARQSMTLLKNAHNILPLNENMTILVAGLRAGDIDSLTGGWSSMQEGDSIVDGIRNRVGDNSRVFYVEDDTEEAAELAKSCDVAVVAVGEPSYVHSPSWGADQLDLTSSQSDMLEAIYETGTPIVVVVLMGRPYILTWCEANADAILVAYYPGNQGARAIAETLFGDHTPTGKLPIQFPRSMDQVLAQEEDVPYDLTNPLYDHGYGITYGMVEPESDILVPAIGVAIVIALIIGIAFWKRR